MRLLAFDASGDACSVALQEGEMLRVRRIVPTTHGHSAFLLPQIEQLLEEIEWTWAHVTHVITTRGPGSFTGIRVSLSVAEALQIANPGLHVAAFTTLEVWYAMARMQAGLEEAPLIVLVDSRRPEPFYQVFDATGAPCSEPGVATAEVINTLRRSWPRAVWAGALGAVEPIEKYFDVDSPFAVLRDFLDPDVLCALAVSSWPATPDLTPLYVRPPAIHVSPPS